MNKKTGKINTKGYLSVKLTDEDWDMLMSMIPDRYVNRSDAIRAMIRKEFGERI